MSAYPLCAIDEHLPKDEPKGHILVVSDHRPLNLGHAATLCRYGYCVYTAITCTDVLRVLGRYSIGDVDLVVFPSVVHGWHHQEGEQRPPGMSPATDRQWQTRNMRAVVDLVCGRQERPPRVLIARELMTFGWYEITADALAEAGLEYGTYSAGNPHAILDFVQ
ncbi:MAG: hypothetical protein ABFE07_15520 [Armatimonadia bacterium]